ncbi:MAG: hypothetical protein H6Q25_1381 [Bacteroidetes bacterium]|nr:hypothetical protein [Bacteroidota bacterium]
MKRIILLTICVCLFFFNGISQSSGAYTAKKANSLKIKSVYKYTPKFEKGFYLRPELSFIYVESDFNNGVIFNLGYQLNPYFYVGIGGGPHFLYSIHREIIKNALNIPLFFHFRSNIFTTKHGFTPFVEMKVGYSLRIVDGEFLERNYQFNFNKIFSFLGLGIEINNFQISSNLLLFYHDIILDDNQYRLFHYDFSVAIAYNIPLKKHKLK